MNLDYKLQLPRIHCVLVENMTSACTRITKHVETVLSYPVEPHLAHYWAIYRYIT